MPSRGELLIDLFGKHLAALGRHTRRSLEHSRELPGNLLVQARCSGPGLWLLDLDVAHQSGEVVTSRQSKLGSDLVCRVGRLQQSQNRVDEGVVLRMRAVPRLNDIRVSNTVVLIGLATALLDAAHVRIEVEQISRLRSPCGALCPLSLTTERAETGLTEARQVSQERVALVHEHLQLRLTLLRLELLVRQDGLIQGLLHRGRVVLGVQPDRRVGKFALLR